MIAADRHGSRVALSHQLSLDEPITFVQMARGLRFRHGTLRLDDLAPSTIWVRHGGTASLGQIATAAFLDLWSDLDGVSRAQSPQGRLSLLDPDAHLVGDPVLRLRLPRITGSGITYDVDVVAGVVPEVSGSSVLFINPPPSDRRTDDSGG